METGSYVIKRNAEDTAKEFQTYLRKSENDEKLVILKAEDKPGSKLGDNYTSVMIRTKLTGIRGNGSPYNKSFMTKTLSNERPASMFLGLSNLFRNEAHVYSKVLPILGLSFGPKCIHYDEDNIIMEDLAERGFANCERRGFLDLEHSVLALKTLAKLHAAALAIKIKNPRLFDELAVPLKEVLYTEGPSQMEECAKWSTKSTVYYLNMIEPRTQDIENITDIFTSNADTIYDTFVRMLNGPKHKYYTICHGDPWANNLLFKHDNNGKILDFKMVDYQISRHISVASDIHYLIYTSVHSSLIEKSYESLLKIYHHTFLEELRRLRVGEEILAELGPKWLEAEMQAYKLYGMFVGCWLVHAILADEEDAKKFEEIDMKNMENFDLSQITVSKQKLDRIQCMTTHCYRRYYLGIINDDLEPLPIK